MKNLIFAIIAIALSSVTIISAQEQFNCPAGTGGMMYGLYGGYGSGMMLFSWITYVLFIILIVAAIYWLFKNANKKNK